MNPLYRLQEYMSVTLRLCLRAPQFYPDLKRQIKGADPLAVKDQLRHTDFKTTQDFYIGSDIEYQREQMEKLALEKPKAEA